MVGEDFTVSATIFREGHDALGANVVVRGPKGRTLGWTPMRCYEPGTDRWETNVRPDAEGAWTYTVEAWSDPVGTWRHAAEIKIAAGIDVDLMLTEGALVLGRAADHLRDKGARGTNGAHGTEGPAAAAGEPVLRDAVQALRDGSRPAEARLHAATAPEVLDVLAAHPLRDHVTVSEPFPLWVDRERALYGSWYEFFPRSEGAHFAAEPTSSAGEGRWVSGTFKTAAERLPAIAEMGFDVVYLPPIHPIGRVNRKGPNNTLDPGPGDPGSPWAIGADEGGHDAVHPDLGTLADFDAFVARAGELGLEVALDLALQAAPDHPWVKEHPEWFTTLADGSIAYAENPPKKYQDIYPLNFDNDPDGLYAEVLRVIRHWMAHGVRIFRVDNPHTKPVQFWEWLLAEVRRTDPDVLFLSEAFTRPPMMQTLAKVGFHQSYTYFTWRNGKQELQDYLTELSQETSAFLRPNFFVNTQDILTAYLQYGGPGAFRVRAVLAATTSPTWGVYSGFELCEHLALRPGQRGVPRLREVPVPPPRLGRVRAGRRPRRPVDHAVPAPPERDQTRASGTATPSQSPLPPCPRRPSARLLQARAGRRRPRCARRGCPSRCRRRHRRRCQGRHGDRRDQPRPARTARVGPLPVHARSRAGLARHRRRPRRTDRRHVAVGRAQLHPSRSGGHAGPHPHPQTRNRMTQTTVPAGSTPGAQPPAAPRTAAPGQHSKLGSDPEWYKRAVFYEVLVRSFADSTNDGIGDITGLKDKLDYLEWLGIDCVWLPPFYTSPLRDGGYDVADYIAIAPDLGTLDDFVGFIEAAHTRGIRVIIDFVMNHTSDQHPWFQASRNDPEGPYGDFYVWADTDEGFPDARIIFVDTETSNWTFDPVRRQYFWHRFFSHQPDLNFDNSRVQDAIVDALRFWLDLGIDGFRLDAVPYLFEQEGTNCENLPRTHEFLKRIRKEVDTDYPDRVLLCEANQWPADVVEYFGDLGSGGDECHMAFHFPVMPRIFMSVRRESRYPISEIMAQTPKIPDSCQWGIFLRNHDELTLEMVADEDRDYMWAEYAKDPRMKANIGIRRRLAPLLENDTNQMELFTALLLSLPGSPIIYYGDEIGMGDNIWLGDRDGVRTPMQWTPDRNAGFSTCDPAGSHCR